MTTDRKPLPGWVSEHVNEYISTNGAKGHIWRGVTTLLLTTTGRKSGEPLLLPLIYGPAGESFVIVASKGGAPEHPAWYLNLVANPEVEVQVLDRKFKARARTATPGEKPALWETMAAIWPAYNDYQAKSSREIPVVILDPIEA